jgi:glycosyltransferase involved in cell wall biosynthesis
MGRYSLSLAKAMIAEAGEHEVVIVMSTAFPRELANLRREFRGLLPAESIVSISMPPGTAVGGNRLWLRDSAERSLRRQLLALKPDAIHIPSVFSGSNDDVVAPWPEAGDDVLWVATLYDLIPLVRADEFLNDRSFRIWYEGRLANLRRADLLLAISEASRTDAIHHLGLPPESVSMIGAAIEPDFSSPQCIANEAEKQLQNLGIKGDFIFYLGGCTSYKNFDGLLRAYALLSISLRRRFKLVLAGQISENSAKALRRRYEAIGLKNEEVLLLVKLSDADLSVLYARCHVFIFPSLYEGFGLPIIEAMSCGAAVICSNTSSMVEVMGDETATFDPTDPKSISDKLREVLENETFRQKLIARGRQHAATFRWQDVARRTWTALEIAREKKGRKTVAAAPPLAMRVAVVASGPATKEPALTLISQLFPGRTETRIEWIFSDNLATSTEEEDNRTKSAKRLTDLACDLDHVFYWIDETTDERWIRPLLEIIPGVVVVMTFFAGNHLTSSTVSTPEMEVAAWQSHGYDAHVNRSRRIDLSPTALYPCNLWLFENAVAIVSPHPWLEGEAKRWYGDHLPPFQVCSSIALIPSTSCRVSQREIWKAGADDFVFLVWLEDSSSSTCGRALVEEAWRIAGLRENSTAQLKFFYGSASLRSGDGWIEGSDAMVALSDFQRSGEPRAVVEALQAGRRVISNTDTPLLPENSARDYLIALPCTPSPQELAAAFLQAMKTPSETTVVSQCANFSKVLTQERTEAAKFSLALGREAKPQPQMDEVEAMALALARKLPRRGPRQLLFDVSELAAFDGKSGIQRVVRCILRRFLKAPPAGFRVEPIRCSEQDLWSYARDFTWNLFETERGEPREESVVEVDKGDIFLTLDLNYRFGRPQIRADFDLWRERGVFLVGMVHDLLPLLNPQWFGSGASEGFAKWLESIFRMHAVISVSKTVSDEAEEWLKENESKLFTHPCEALLGHSHHGADLEESKAGMTPKEILPPASAFQATSFLMVGTVEPRKGHEQVLDAFEHLWKGGSQARLVIVGKHGWHVELLVARMKKHPELGKRLLWFEGISDEELLGVYSGCQVLLAASYGEGFGLPLIEGARHGLPIIARDIPIFREVAGEHAFYFSASDPQALARELTRWLEMFERGTAPISKGMKWLTWEQSANNLWFEIVRCQQSAKGVFDEA